MVYLARSPHPWILVGVITAYCVSCLFLTTLQALIVGNSLLMVGSGVVGLVYGKEAIRALRGRDAEFRALSPVDQAKIQHITFGIAIAWIDTHLWRLIIAFWLLADFRKSLVDNYIVSGFYVICFLGSMYHLSSPGAIARTFRWRVVACSLVVIVAAIISGIQIYAPPNLIPQAEWVEPYIPR